MRLLWCLTREMAATRFDERILLQKGKKPATLRDAALYITKLPKAEHDAEEWQTAMEALLLAAESGDVRADRHDEGAGP